MPKNFEAAVLSGRNRNRVYDIVICAIEEAAESRGITRKDLADKIGCSKAQISQTLSGPSNWTLDTISNLLFAIDAEMDYEVVFNKMRAISNNYHPSSAMQIRPADTSNGVTTSAKIHQVSWKNAH